MLLPILASIVVIVVLGQSGHMGLASVAAMVPFETAFLMNTLQATNARTKKGDKELTQFWIQWFSDLVSALVVVWLLFMWAFGDSVVDACFITTLFFYLIFIVLFGAKLEILMISYVFTCLFGVALALPSSKRKVMSVQFNNGGGLKYNNTRNSGDSVVEQDHFLLYVLGVIWVLFTLKTYLVWRQVRGAYRLQPAPKYEITVTPPSRESELTPTPLGVGAVGVVVS